MLESKFKVGAVGTLILGIWMTGVQADTWGAVTTYDFFPYSGEHGYGIAWNYSSKEEAIIQAVKSCQQNQPPLPPLSPSEYATRCDTTISAFSSDWTKRYIGGEEIEHLLKGPGHVMEVAFNRARCVLVVEQSFVAGVNHIRYVWELSDSERELRTLAEERRHLRVEMIACNDQ